MPRLGYTYLAEGLDRIPTTPEEFEQSGAYRRHRFASRADFLALAGQGWYPELHRALARVLDPARPVLSVGSGLGEHEVVLTLSGFDIVASDIVDDALDEARRLFPELRTRSFDILDPRGEETYDDVLIAALDYALDDAQLAGALENVSRLLRPAGRIVLVLRYRSTPATWLVDRALLPAWAALRRRRGQMLRRSPQGYRRSVREVVALAGRCGYDAHIAGYAGFAAELTRIGLDLKTPRLYDVARRLDERMPMLNTATVFVLEPR